MKGTINLNEIMSAVQSMSKANKLALVEEIMNMMNGETGSSAETCGQTVNSAYSTRPDCPHCRASGKIGFVTKRGFKCGSQRYYCKSCGKTFVPTTKTAFERSRKSSEVWKKFIEMTISCKSLVECSRECNICYQTAFTWRHKVLNAFRMHQSTIVMSGRVEMDEMLIPISYKGNHVKGNLHERRIRLPGDDNGLPRKSVKRSNDNKPMSSKERACIVCLVENGNKAFFGAVPGVGFMLPTMLDDVVGKHVNKETALMLVDQYRVTLNYLEENKYKYIKLASNTSKNSSAHKPEIIGELHLQHVNSLHRHIRRFLAAYCGVSTKYLENYISLFMWLKNLKAKKQSRKLEFASFNRMATPDCYISRKALEARPAVPKCA